MCILTRFRIIFKYRVGFFIFSLITITSLSKAQHSQWEKLFMYDGKPVYYESSELEDPNAEYGDIGKYSAYGLFDENVATAWVEGVKGDGIGEYLLIGQKKTLPDKIHFNNGYQKTNSLYLKNNRPKTLKISLYIAYHLPADVTELGGNFYCLPLRDSLLLEGKLIPKTFTLKLKDEMGPQEFTLPFDKEIIADLKTMADVRFKVEFADRLAEILKYSSGNDRHESFYGYIVKLEIIDVYKGSQWDDTCISDIWFSNVEK